MTLAGETSCGDFDAEIFVEDLCELLSVLDPVAAERRDAESCDPVAVEFVDDRVDAVALQPPIAERSAVAKRFVRAPLGEPGLLPEQRLQDGRLWSSLIVPEIQTDKRVFIAHVEEAIRQRGIGPDHAVQDLRACDRTKRLW